jgi:hypothetical protein
MADEQTTETTPQTLTVELDEKGLPKALPEPLQRELDRRVNASVQTALKNAEKKGGLTPAEREELAALREDKSRLEQSVAEHNKDWQEALRIQAERLEAKRAADIAARDAEVKAREARIAKYQDANKLGAIRAAAVAAGARDESLPELEKLLGSDVKFDPETDDPFIPGADGTKQPIEQFVTAYLQAHPHHLGRGKGTPGRATGGASFAGRAINPADAKKEAALNNLAAEPTHKNVEKAVGAFLTGTGR